MRKHLPLLLAFATLLAGCGDTSSEASDPTPNAEIRQRIENSRIASVRVGQPFDLDGCQVQVHEVFVNRPGVLGGNSFTMATANCPTARVTATNEHCGKNCVHDTVGVERTGTDSTPSGAAPHTDDLENQPAMRQAVEKAVLQAKRAQLQADLDRVSKQLQDHE